MKYSDSVVLIRKSPDGSLTRVNAFVLASFIQAKDATRSTGLRDNRGLLPEGEYLDLMFLEPLPEGVNVKTTAPSELFKPASLTPPWKDGANIGWEAADKELRAEHAYWTNQASKKEAALQARIAQLEAAANPPAVQNLP
jgi:hypothetical protein